MSSKTSQQTTLKKLMKIIYQKQKQIQKYKKQLKHASKQVNQGHHQTDTQCHKYNSNTGIAAYLPHPPKLPHLALSSQERLQITRQILENRKFLQTASLKLNCMENKIVQLQADLQEQQNRNALLQQQISILKSQCQDKNRQNLQLKALNQVFQKQREKDRMKRVGDQGNLFQKQGQIQVLVIQNQKLKLVSDQIKYENNQLKQRLKNAQSEVNKQLKQLHKNFRTFIQNRKNIKSYNLLASPLEKRGVPSQAELNSLLQINSNSNINCLSRMVRNQDKQIKTHTFILEKLEHSLEDKLSQIMNLIKNWQDLVVKRQEDCRKNYEKQLQQHSFGNIQNFLADSILIRAEEADHNKKQTRPQTKEQNEQRDSLFYQSSLYKRNEQQLLKNLQKQCQKQQINPVQISIQKQKLVQLSEVRQSLKMTKQVNEQLFDELNKKQNMITMCKEMFRSLEDKKLLKNQGSQYVKKMRTVLGVVN